MHIKLLGLLIAGLIAGSAAAQETYKIGAVNSVTGIVGERGAFGFIRFLAMLMGPDRHDPCTLGWVSGLDRA